MNEIPFKGDADNDGGELIYTISEKGILINVYDAFGDSAAFRLDKRHIPDVEKLLEHLEGLEGDGE
ncbi:hypothetical protein 049ML003_80 [Bacillus phage 049ML003]|nr:hypothetical protein 049ML003_80 [Bacillus phage 049ML003]